MSATGNTFPEQVTHTHDFSASTNSDSHSHNVSGNTNNQGGHNHGFTVYSDTDDNSSIPNAPDIAYDASAAGTATTNNNGAHQHSISGNTNNDAHSHSVSGTTGNSGNTAHSHSLDLDVSGSTESGGNQNTGSIGSGDAIDNRPLYYALAYIMRTT